MIFLSDRRITVLVLVLILGFLPILGAQTTPSLPGIGELLPASRNLHFPESSVSKATAGTLSGDPDAFMSSVNWSSIKNMESTFVLGGVDEWGLSLGFAKKFGKLYLGASYSGDLIDEIYRRLTNKELNPFWKVDEKVNSPNSPVKTYLKNADGNSPGAVVSNNDVNIIIGAGVFGLRLGFAEYIRSVRNSSAAPYWAFQDSLETSLKPNLELGFNIPAEKVTIKPSLRAAFDIHQFQSQTGYLEHDFSNPAIPVIYWVIRDDLINFIEPSTGFTVALEFAFSDTASIEFALEGDGVFRLYRGKDDPNRISSSLVYGDASGGYPFLPLFKNGNNDYLISGGTFYPNSNIIPVTHPGNVAIPLNLRVTGAPSVAFTGSITDRVTLGAKIAIDSGLDLQTIETDTGAGVLSSTVLVTSTAPDLALGASFHLIPGHFSLHAGMGVQLFSHERVVFSGKDAGGNATPTTTVSTFGLPAARLGGGLTVNLTQAMVLDVMAFSSELDFNSTKFNMILTIKK